MNFIYSDKLFSLMEEDASKFKKIVVLAEELFNSAVILKESEDDAVEGNDSEVESFKDKILKFLKRIIDTVKKYLIKLRDFAKKIFRKILGKFDKKVAEGAIKLTGFATFDRFVEDSDKFANGVSNVVSFIAKETSPEAAKASFSYNDNSEGMKDIAAEDKQLLIDIFGNNLGKYSDLTEKEYTSKEVEAFRQKLQIIIGQFNSTNDLLLKSISHLEDLKGKIDKFLKLYKANGKKIALDVLTRRTKALFNNASFLGEITKLMNNWLKIHTDYSSKLVAVKE